MPTADAKSSERARAEQNSRTSTARAELTDCTTLKGLLDCVATRVLSFFFSFSYFIWVRVKYHALLLVTQKKTKKDL
jgi:hypothetical protein